MAPRIVMAAAVFAWVCGARPPESNSSPIAVQLKPPSGGATMDLMVTCGDLSKKECAHIAKPVSVELLERWDTSDLQCNARTCAAIHPAFSPAPAGGTDLTVTLLDRALQPGMSVRVFYDGGRLNTGWKPVIPTPDQTLCCEFNPLTVRARIPIDGRQILYLEAKDSKGRSKPIRVRGTLNEDYWWSFQIDPNHHLAAGDSVSVTTDVGGKNQVLAKGTYADDSGAPANAPATPGSSEISTASTAPVESLTTASVPAVAVTGQCSDPHIRFPLQSGGTLVFVTFGCKTKISGVVLFVDNQPKTEPEDLTWTQISPFELKATLKFRLEPYRWVKVLQFDPAEANADSAEPVKVSDSTPGTVGPEEDWWVPQPSGAPGRCPAPTVSPSLHAGESDVTVTFPPPAGGLECAPDFAKTFIYVDNKRFEMRHFYRILDLPLTYKVTIPLALKAYQRVKVLQFSPRQNQPDSEAQIVPGPLGVAPAAVSIITKASSCANPYIQDAPGLTDSIAVILGCMPGDPSKDLTMMVNGKPPDGGVIWAETGSSPITFTAKLSAPLNDGDSVQVLQTGQRDPGFSPAQIAAGPPKSPPASSVQAVQEGATSVTGFAKGVDKVRVQVVDGKNLQQQIEAPVDSTTHSFTASFSNPIQADQQLQIFGLAKNGTQSDSATQIDVQPLGLDWGRVRGYFTAGVILSNNNSQFNLTNANTFLDFNIDKGWRQSAPSFNQIGHRFSEKLRFNTYFDARLTAIASGTSGTTSSAGTTPTLTGGSGTGSGSSTGSSGSGAAASTSNPSANVTSLLTNNQAAELQVGAYLPFTVASWDFNEKRYSLFAAPIGKVGFYTVTDAGSTANQAAETATRSASTFFPFYSYGVRLGHRRDYTTWDGSVDHNRAAEQLSYLDISVGKWSNFEYLQPFNFTTALQPTCTMPTSSPSTAACDVRERLWRYGFEGLLVIPNTPLIVGLSANVAAQHPRAGPNMMFLTPPDDLRFLFGVRFGASQLMGVLSKISGTSGK